MYRGGGVRVPDTEFIIGRFLHSPRLSHGSHGPECLTALAAIGSRARCPGLSVPGPRPPAPVPPPRGSRSLWISGSARRRRRAGLQRSSPPAIARRRGVRRGQAGAARPARGEWGVSGGRSQSGRGEPLLARPARAHRGQRPQEGDPGVREVAPGAAPLPRACCRRPPPPPPPPVTPRPPRREPDP